MCGRFTFRTKKLAQGEFPLIDIPELPPRYNIAPTQQVPAIRERDGMLEFAMLRWGLIPPWAKDIKKMPLLINAMSETVDTKPSFRAAFKRRRCLILADGYYEWKAVGKMKQPYYHRLQDDGPFAFAGLWEHWEGPDGPVESCTILTTPANQLTMVIHDRMPAILDRDGRAAWLDPAIDPPALKELLRPYPAADMVSYPVSPAVNKAGIESPEFIVPLAG